MSRWQWLSSHQDLCEHFCKFESSFSLFRFTIMMYRSLLQLVTITCVFISAKAFVSIRTQQSPVVKLSDRQVLPSPKHTVFLGVKSQNNVDSEDKDIFDTSGMSTPLDRPLLALVDATALMGFAAVGKASHSGPDGSIELAAVLQTALPFLTAWFVTSPLTNVYKETDQSKNLILGNVQQVLVGWAVAIPLGCALRGVLKGYVPPTSFVIVTLIATLVILSVARVLFAILEDFFVEMVN